MATWLTWQETESLNTITLADSVLHNYRQSIGLLGLAALIFSSLAIAQSVDANPTTTAPRRVARFYVRGTHGFKVTLVAAVEGRDSPVRIVAEDHRAGGEYQALGTVTTRAIHASFGSLGSVSLRFRPSGRVLHSLDEGGECSLDAKTHLGTFVGTFRFRGEGGYTALTAHRVAGGIGAPTAPIDEREQGKLGCLNADHTYITPPSQIEQRFSDAEGRAAGGTPGRGIIATVAAANEATVFFAWGFSFRHPEQEGATPDSCLFMALREETRGSVSIAREVFGGGPVSQCPYEESSGSFSVAPEKPFSGTAGFQRNADGSTSWLGSLAVPMLGVGVVALAGPEFKSEFVKK